MAKRRTTPARRPSGDEPQPPPDSHLRILDAIRGIPPGYVSTYGEIAKAAGLPGKARLVGRVLRDSMLADGVPWHRVIGATGRISERPGDGGARQRRLLEVEGVLFERDRVDLSVYLWRFRRRTAGPSRR